MVQHNLLGQLHLLTKQNRISELNSKVVYIWALYESTKIKVTITYGAVHLVTTNFVQPKLMSQFKPNFLSLWPNAFFLKLLVRWILKILKNGQDIIKANLADWLVGAYVPNEEIVTL